MKLGLFVVTLSMLLLTACSTMLPVHEAESPENLSWKQYRVGGLEAYAPSIGTPLTTESQGAESDTIIGVRGGLGLPAGFQVNVDLMTSSEGGDGVSGSLKYQWFGDSFFEAKAGNFSMTSVVRTFSVENDSVKIYGSDGNDYGDIKASGGDFTQLFGYRFSDVFGVYGGPKFISGKVKAEYRDHRESTTPLQSDSRSFTGEGGVAGVFFDWTRSRAGFNLTVEYTNFELPATYGTRDVTYEGVAVYAAVPMNFQRSGGGSGQ